MQITTVGLDLAKNVFQVHGTDKNGKTVLRKKLTRKKILPFFANLKPCLIGMETTGSANYWARELKKLGHTVRLMAPQFVKPYRKGSKNDPNDAGAICEAVSRPSMHFVEPKTREQQDIQAVHRIRERLIADRTARANQLRGLLAEYGIIIPKGIANIKKAMPLILEDAENGLTSLARELFSDLYGDLKELDEKVSRMDLKIKQIFDASSVCQRLAKVEGIGPVTATAYVAVVGTGKSFKNGRQAAASLGLVPRQHSSGDRQLLLGITKKGDRYLRGLLIHGGRAAVRAAQRKDDARSRWINAVRERRNKNIAAVAVANKNARILWALLVGGEEYRAAT